MWLSFAQFLLHLFNDIFHCAIIMITFHYLEELEEMIKSPSEHLKGGDSQRKLI